MDKTLPPDPKRDEFVKTSSVETAGRKVQLEVICRRLFRRLPSSSSKTANWQWCPEYASSEGKSHGYDVPMIQLSAIQTSPSSVFSDSLRRQFRRPAEHFRIEHSSGLYSNHTTSSLCGFECVTREMLQLFGS